MLRPLAAALLALGAQLARAVLHTRRPNHYFWPSARGNVGQYSVSPHAGPQNLSTSLAWSWQHPKHRFATVTLGTLIDDELSVYLASFDKFRKFSKEGTLLWEYKPPGNIPTVPSLLDGAVYGSDSLGNAWAVSMENGKLIWMRQAAKKVGGDTAFVGAQNGTVVLATDPLEECCNLYPYSHTVGNMHVRALSAATGEQLWEFAPDAGVWNFFPAFTPEGTVAFQDHTGKAYVLKLGDGSLVWKRGGKAGTFTDGSVIVAPNNILYAVNLLGPLKVGTEGALTAYSLGDGQQLWRRELPMPPNIFPAVGRLGSGPKLSVVQAVGMQCTASRNDVYAFDAETGEQQWVWKGPDNPNPWCKGDLEGLAVRAKILPERAMCVPNPWGAPTIDSNGRVFAGDQDGKFYAIKDVNGDGIIDTKTEVTSYNMDSAFSSPGSAHAPGMTAVATCDRLFVFRS